MISYITEIKKLTWTLLRYSVCFSNSAITFHAMFVSHRLRSLRNLHVFIIQPPLFLCVCECTFWKGFPVYHKLGFQFWCSNFLLHLAFILHFWSSTLSKKAKWCLGGVKKSSVLTSAFLAAHQVCCQVSVEGLLCWYIYLLLQESSAVLVARRNFLTSSDGFWITYYQ